MIVILNHTSKGILRFEKVGKFETQNGSYMVVQPHKSHPKNRYDKEKVASYSIQDMNHYDGQN